MTEFDARDILLKAASLVEAGWVRGWLVQRGVNGGWNYCAQGAIIEVERELLGDPTALPYHTKAAVNARKLLEREVGGNVTMWNDHKATSGAEVAERMRKAAS